MSARILLSSIVLSIGTVAGFSQHSADVIVYGSTPGGFCAAIAAAREGASVILLEPTAHVGGLSTGGLSHCDSNQMVRKTLMGLFDEWHRRVVKDYTDRGLPDPYNPSVKDQSLWTFEPHVAMRVTMRMLKEAGVTVETGRHLKSVTKEGRRITSLNTKDGTFRAKVFVDGSYEGDLMAAAGVDWTIGREGRAEFGESYAGKRYPKAKMNISGFDEDGRLLPLVTTSDAGPDEAGDKNIMTYSFRLCLTRDPARMVPIPKPANYNPARFELARRALKVGAKVGFDLYPLPGGKLDGNNSIGGQVSFGLIGAGNGWHSADETGRGRIWEAHKQYTIEFLYFLRTDPAVPPGVRDEFAGLGLCKDEFAETAHFPPALYVRESRRMKGMHVLSQRDIIDSPEKDDPIAISSFPIDSHDCQRVALKDGGVINEGTIFPVRVPGTKVGYAYHVPYRSVLPQAAQCTNLLVPVALSSTHVAISSLRIEGAWMVIGQGAGVAAALAAKQSVAVQDLPYAVLRQRLLAQGQVLALPAPRKSAAAKDAGFVPVKSLPAIVPDDTDAELTGGWTRSTNIKPRIGGGHAVSGVKNARGGNKASATFSVEEARSGEHSAAAPRDSLPLSAPEWPPNYRLHLDGAASVLLADGLMLTLNGKGPHDLAVEHPAKGAPVLRVWSGGKLVRGPEDMPALAKTGAKDFPDAQLGLGADFTAMAEFESTGQGTLFSMCAPAGKWSPDAKALFIRGGRLVYDIGWLGAMTAGPKVNDGRPHSAVLSVSGGTARLWLDGKLIAEKANFTRPDQKGHVFKVGRAAPDFAGDFTNGKMSVVKIWRRALPPGEIALLFNDGGAGANTQDFTYTPKAGGKPVVEGGSGWVQALERSDHAEIVAGWNAKTLEEGATIYKTLCVVCHGTKEQPGSLPTALRFAEGVFKNGGDPFSMYLTLTKGFGQMVPQPQYTTAQKYAVIHYIRETFLRPHNPSQLKDVPVSSLPRGLARAEEEKADTSLPPYQRMELGNALFWTLEVAAGNIAQKGIAIRLDDGPGGVTKGRAWMIYDHDTMRAAAASTGAFVDWKGIAFDGSHGTHTSLIGEKQFVLPVEPGWSVSGDFEDTRTAAKDGKKYGPVAGLRFLGLYKHQDQSVIAASIHGTRVLESPAWMDYGSTPILVRTVNIAEAKLPLFLRVAPDSVSVVSKGEGELKRENGFWVAKLASGARSRFFISRVDPASLDTMAKSFTAPLDLAPLTKGAPAQWPQTVATTSVAGKVDAAFVADDFSLPVENPFQSWMRPGGFDFTPDGKAAIVAMWNGDVWRVDGVMDKAPAKLTWHRIASGLFQPLGVKFRAGGLFVLCRDQLAKLVDLNGDGETDFIECFNDDAQVTEHFHEFAMGLQTDAAGNFYYAKSGRHALDSVVPQHGTLLKVSADGMKTEILATGFRAANGVCLNDDGTFLVTDQEGFWTPKNRINRVKVGGFYGNMYGYTSVTDESDAAMEQPMVWITNDKDRSPAELVWVPKDAWGNLGGSLLNLSYGTGRAFIVPHEEVNGQWQGAVCELPMPAFATGIMRGRFGRDGALYTCGMFAWAGNATAPGGFHRIRRGHGPARVPLALHAAKGALTATFSDPITDTKSAIKIWSLKRSKTYGSKHYDEHELTIRGVTLGNDRRTVRLEIPDLAPTLCYELRIGDRVLHGTLHQLASPDAP